MTPVMLDSPPLTPIPNIAGFPISGSRKPRAYWARTTLLAAFALVAVSVYLLFISHPALRAPSFIDTARPATADGSRWSPETFRNALKHKKPVVAAADLSARPQITLNATQELAAVSSFIASLPQNMIPATVDPSLPLDPQLILDFDTRGPHAEEELQAVMQDVWTRNPVMLYSKVHSPVSREIKQVLKNLYLRPAPTIVDVDTRPDEQVLTQLLYRLTSASELPILLVGGRTIAEPKEIKWLAETGDLQKAITKAGAVVDGSRKKKPKKL
uniref:N/A n=1 Tax=Ganoderma boninense TaxID=34458 RepID=A0A5K1K2B7_9APHY|nr:N/A [Ganoderma boninense]